MAKRTNILVILLAMTSLLGGFGLLEAKAGPAFAEEGAVLEVYYDDVLMQAYTKTDLEDIAAAEGDRNYRFSAMNTYPTPGLIPDDAQETVRGATVSGILEDAFGVCVQEGIPDDMESLEGDQLIEIRENGGNNPYRAVFTVDQFEAERYYFPNVKNEKGREGAAPLAESYEGKQVVPAIITTEETEEPSKTGRFMIGQLTPNDQNQPEWVQGVVTTAEKPGRIVIRSSKAEQWNKLTRTNVDATGQILIGGKVTFNREINSFAGGGGQRYWIYYTMDGTEPTRDSAIYNCNNFDFGQAYEVINKPVIEKAGPVEIRAKVIGNGKLESETAVFRLTGVTKLTTAKPTLKKLKLKKKTITLYWTRVKAAGGYEIYRATKKKGKYKKIKTIKNGNTLSYKNTKLKKKKKYYYKVRAYRIVEGKYVYSSFSAVKYKKVK